MPSSSRKQRGAETQRLVAEYMRDHGWPYATDAGAGRNGNDILNTPGLNIEVKARRDFSVTAWLRQASGVVTPGVGLVVSRPDGYGPAKIEDWPMIFRLGEGIILLRQAGYGDPIPGSLLDPEEG